MALVSVPAQLEVNNVMFNSGEGCYYDGSSVADTVLSFLFEAK